MSYFCEFVIIADPPPPQSRMKEIRMVVSSDENNVMIFNDNLKNGKRNTEIYLFG